MKSNCVYIPIFNLIYNFAKYSHSFSANQSINKYDLYLFLKSDSKQNYSFKGCFSLSLNFCSDDCFEVNCKNENEFKFFIKQDDKANSLDTFFNEFEHQARANPIESMETLASCGFVRFDGKIENGTLKNLVCVKNNTEIKINTSRMNILNTADKQKAWNDLLSERKTQTEMEKIDYKNSSLDDKIKIAKNQIQKENKPMSQNNFTNYIEE